MAVNKLYANGTVSAAGSTQIVAAPGVGRQIVIDMIVLQSKGDDAVNVQILNGVLPIIQVYCASAGNGVAWALESGKEVELDRNTRLALDLDGAYEVQYTFRYWFNPKVG